MGRRDGLSAGRTPGGCRRPTGCIRPIYPVACRRVSRGHQQQLTDRRTTPPPPTTTRRHLEGNKSMVKSSPSETKDTKTPHFVCDELADGCGQSGWFVNGEQTTPHVSFMIIDFRIVKPPLASQFCFWTMSMWL